MLHRFGGSQGPQTSSQDQWDCNTGSSLTCSSENGHSIFAPIVAVLGAWSGTLCASGGNFSVPHGRFWVDSCQQEKKKTERVKELQAIGPFFLLVHGFPDRDKGSLF